MTDDDEGRRMKRIETALRFVSLVTLGFMIIYLFSVVARALLH